MLSQIPSRAKLISQGNRIQLWPIAKSFFLMSFARIK
uniref:Uncharacterized protein n=1 Tax=Anguilla anguilla TaxID=7936 RepID=A0A0E9W9I0_ANGAN